MGFFSALFGKTDNSQLTEVIKDGAFLVDVRTPAEFSAGSVKGAVNIPLDKVQSHLSKFKNKKSIVVFCRSGSRSGQAKSILEQNGFQYVINGGTWENVNQAVSEETMKEFWDERYSREEFVYGVNPNEYLKAKLAEIPVGKILFPAEGEGRNAVFSATLGWDAFAFDLSKEGKNKAELLAQRNGVQIAYKISDMEHISYPENSFDALALVYAHFPLENRREYHKKLSSFLKKGGLLVLEGFSKKHLENQKRNPKAGGPKNAEMLYDLNELKSDFEKFDFTECYEAETNLTEGVYHVGKASVIRIFATKN